MKKNSAVDLDNLIFKDEELIYDPHEWVGALNGEQVYNDPEIKSAFLIGLKELCDENDGNILEAMACYTGDDKPDSIWEPECDDESYYLMDRIIKQSLMKRGIQYNSLTYSQLVNLQEIVLGVHPWKQLITDIKSLVS